MNGRANIEAAFSHNGTNEIPAVICYEGIFIRDHWDTLISYPWWYTYEPDIEKQVLWRTEAIEKIGQDWTCLPYFYSYEDIKNIKIFEHDNNIYLYDERKKTKRKLEKPKVSGWGSKSIHSVKPGRLACTKDEIDSLIPVPDRSEDDNIIKQGKNSLALRIKNKYDKTLFPIVHVGSPLWYCYQIWGFEGMMTNIADNPELVRYACDKYLQLRLQEIKRAFLLGAKGIWFEECFTDMISPETFKEINVPVMRQMVDETRSFNMKSIYYYCGNPAKKLDMILSCGTDAVSFEESKKGFKIDIHEIVEYVNGRCTVLGNLDSYEILEKGTEEQLEMEIKRQIKAGIKNRGKFIMSTGSPVTPETTIARVGLYCDMVHEFGKI